MPSYDLELREAQESDASQLIAFLDQVGQESDFMSLGQEGIQLTDAEMARVIANFASSSNQIYLLALLDGQIAGLVTISSDQRFRTAHIGDLFIVLAKKYWGQGLASILLEEALDWAENYSPLLRVQLTVQVRNQKALALYQKFAFKIEGEQEAGARLDDGTLVPIYLMGRLLK